jgi:hypothetical protein
MSAHSRRLLASCSRIESAPFLRLQRIPLRARSATKSFVLHVWLVATLLAPAPLLAQQSDTVWAWFTRCRQPRNVALDVRLDLRLVYHSSFPICRVERKLEPQKRLEFSFKAPKAIVWKGYRSDEGDTTVAHTDFKVSIWQAGGDPDDLLLGIGVSAADGLHMNTILIVWPDKANLDQLADGLSVTSRPY